MYSCRILDVDCLCYTAVNDFLLQEALAIFESLKMWDEVVLCYKGLNQVEKAESLIRKLLLDDPNQPLLHCYLGDLSGNPEHYQRAIEVCLLCLAARILSSR